MVGWLDFVVADVVVSVRRTVVVLVVVAKSVFVVLDVILVFIDNRLPLTFLLPTFFWLTELGSLAVLAERSELGPHWLADRDDSLFDSAKFELAHRGVSSYPVSSDPSDCFLLFGEKQSHWMLEFSL